MEYLSSGYPRPSIAESWPKHHSFIHSIEYLSFSITLNEWEAAA